MWSHNCIYSNPESVIEKCRISRICTVFLCGDNIRMVCVQSTVHSRCHTSTDSLSPPDSIPPPFFRRSADYTHGPILIVLVTSWDDKQFVLASTFLYALPQGKIQRKKLMSSILDPAAKGVCVSCSNILRQHFAMVSSFLYALPPPPPLELT
jgi:hypothetical protein